MRRRFSNVSAVLSVVVGMTCLPSTLIAAGITDVALNSGGVLQGRLIGPQDMPLAHARVMIRQPNRPAVTTVTTEDGSVTETGLCGGCCQVETDRGGRFYRLWSPGTAPPKAASNVDLQASDGKGSHSKSVEQSVVATLMKVDKGPPREGNPGGNGIGNGPGGQGTGHTDHSNGQGVGHTTHGNGHGYRHGRPASP